ncbi:hypothetical protein FRC20_002601 [Serendipita sp. 405]|nr:hypothetical protein FRC20_002601 [Serendipita sp. 405]
MPYFQLPQDLEKRDVAERFTPNGAQKVTLIVAGCYIVGIAILWNVPYLKYLLYPFKLLTVALHEVCGLYNKTGERSNPTLTSSPQLMLLFGIGFLRNHSLVMLLRGS